MRLIRILTVQIVVIGALGLPVQIAQAQSDPNPSRPWESSAPDYGRAWAVESESRRDYAWPGEFDKADETAWVEWIRPGDGSRSEIFIETWFPRDQKTGEPLLDEIWPVIFHPTVYENGNQCKGTNCDYRATLISHGYAYSTIHLPGSGKSPGCFDRHGESDAAALSAAVEYLAGLRPDTSDNWTKPDRDPEDAWSNGELGGAGISYSGGAVLNVAARGTDAARDAIDAVVVGAPHISDYDTQWIFDGVRSSVVSQIHPIGFIAEKNGVFPGGRFLEPFREHTKVGGRTIPTGHVPTEADLDELGDRSKYGLAREYGCHVDAEAENINNLQANVTDYYYERDLRRFAANVEMPVLTFHGHTDLVPISGVPPMVQAGFFDQLPGGDTCGPNACKRGLFGVWGHNLPSSHDMASGWNRRDFRGNGMLVAWFDRWVKNKTDVNVEDWPVAQVQGTDGQWRAEPNWPTTGGPVAQLSLGPAATVGGVGSLGEVLNPSGESSFVEAIGNDAETKPLQQLVFETSPLRDRLQITGQPVADLWVKLDRPDAHIAARLEIFGPDGARIEQTVGRGESSGWSYGLRSARHLEYGNGMIAGLEDNRFAQRNDVDPPVGTAIRVPVRFQPTDLVVPKGGRLRLTLSGSTMVNSGLQQASNSMPPAANDPLVGFSEPSWFSPLLQDDASQNKPTENRPTSVTILHDCGGLAARSGGKGSRASTLRFLMPRAKPDLLNVRDTDAEAQVDPGYTDGRLVPLASKPVPKGYVSDGGPRYEDRKLPRFATSPVCGEKPSRITDVISSLGPRTPR